MNYFLDMYTYATHTHKKIHKFPHKWKLISMSFATQVNLICKAKKSECLIRTFPGVHKVLAMTLEVCFESEISRIVAQE